MIQYTVEDYHVMQHIQANRIKIVLPVKQIGGE